MSNPSHEASRAGDECFALIKTANERAKAGDMDATIRLYREALALDPGKIYAHDDLIYLLHFHPDYDDQDIFRELAIWERQNARPLAGSILPHQNNREANRRLKVGYVSPEFCRQAESFFTIPLFESHDHQQFEIHCYSSNDRSDDITDRIKKCTDVWHDALTLDDAALAEQIRRDQIDILVDLTMHMRLSRMLTFARKPAPVQLTWLAYPGGTGLRTMDYRLTDRYLDPPDQPGWSTEESCRLPDCWVCFDPQSQAALATPRTSGPIRFGSLNHPRKMIDSNLRLWAKLLRQVEGSRIILHISAADHRKRAEKIFGGEGVTPDRLEFKGHQPRWEYLRNYDQIDIALDTLPYNGITTTCDALWMGTPVVSLIGKTACGRVGLGILSTVGLPDLVAADSDQFIAIAARLAEDRARLIDHRKNLRQRMIASPLMDANRFTRNVEAAYRWMWQRWCHRPDRASLEPIPPEAIDHHRAARWREAESIYTQILQRQPQHPDALNLLGVIAGHTGRPQLAVDMLSRAVAADPNVAAYYCNLGVILQSVGRVDQAMAAYHRTIALDPDFAEAYSNLGNSLGMTGDLKQAIKAYRRAIELRPDFAPAHSNLGNVLKTQGDLDGAIAALRKAVELDPTLAAYHCNLGVALSEKELLDEAIESLRRALEIDARYAPAHQNLGNVLVKKRQFDDAIASLNRALEINPKSAAVQQSLANALRGAGRFDEAVAAFRRAQQLSPDYADAHYNCALTLLLLGDFKQGWPEHSWRARAQPAFLFPVARFTQPQWDGRGLNGRTIFLHAEQGFGDTIQFVRYAPLVAHRGGRVILGCQPELLRVLRGLPGVQQIVTMADPLPTFDVHCPLLSLPAAFATDIDSIPSQTPYLTADAAIVQEWGTKLGRGRFKVGLAWSGNPRHKLDHERSIPLQQFAPFAERKDIEFFSLQKGEPAKQPPPPGLNLTDHTAALNDFADTAALIANLDLVIAADTAVAHLAGAMGKPVWLLIPFIPDWRWMLNRYDSPWYPTMRLFRQNADRDWATVVRDVANQLAQPWPT